MSSTQQPQYVYHQPAPSVIEGVVSTILNPGVNAQTYSVLNVTLIALFIVISVILYAFEFMAERFKLHLWIFLAVTLSLILSVNWFFVRYQTYGGDDEEEEELLEDEGEAEEEEEKEVVREIVVKQPKKKAAATTTTARKSARKKAQQEEDEDEQ